MCEIAKRVPASVRSTSRDRVGEDGSPVFSREETPQTLCLDEAAPVLVIVRDGGTLRTAQGDLHEIFDFIEGLTLPY